METNFKDLDEFIKSNPKPQELKRALSVKLILSNHSINDIKFTLNVSTGYATNCKTRYLKYGIDSLKSHYKGRASYLNSTSRQEVINWIKSQNHWDLISLVNYIKTTYSVIYKSKQSYYDLFKEAGLSWKKAQKINPKKKNRKS